MTPEAFAEAFHNEKLEILESYFSSTDETAVSTAIRKMNLDSTQKGSLKHVVEMILDDTLYSILLGLDGSASIGGVQQKYSILDETGTRIGNEGEIEVAAYEQFHGSNS